VVNTPPDGGPVVLLTVMIAVAFLAVGVAVLFAWNWAHERMACREAEIALREAEDIVLALTGLPMSRVRPSLFHAGGLPVIDRRALPREGWRE
jgi:Asp/Glu/hydantoin racemase